MINSQVYANFVEESKGEMPHKRFWRRTEDGSQHMVKLEWIYLAQYTIQRQAFVYTVIDLCLHYMVWNFSKT
jgi:hypothetical protein